MPFWVAELLGMLRNSFVALSSKQYLLDFFLKMRMCPCRIYPATSWKGLRSSPIFTSTELAKSLHKHMITYHLKAQSMRCWWGQVLVILGLGHSRCSPCSLLNGDRWQDSYFLWSGGIYAPSASALTQPCASNLCWFKGSTQKLRAELDIEDRSETLKIDTKIEGCKLQRSRTEDWSGEAEDRGADTKDQGTGIEDWGVVFCDHIFVYWESGTFHHILPDSQHVCVRQVCIH